MGRRRQKLFSTGEVARIVDTTPKTVARWIDEGLLEGTRLPGTVERRVHRDALRAFFVQMEWKWAVKELDTWGEPPVAEGPDKS